MINDNFIALCSKAWAIQILGYIFEENDPRISPIAHHFSIGRTSVSAAVSHLISLGYLTKNSGHGHPLRPAYVLTKKGKKVAEWAANLNDVLNTGDWVVARRSWTLPTLRETIPTRRFNELRRELTPVTDRALSETLKILGENRWIARKVNSSLSPPGVTYMPSGKGNVLVPILQNSQFI